MATAPDDILSSAMATALLLEPSEHCHGARRPWGDRGAEHAGSTRSGPEPAARSTAVDAVVVGMDPSFDYSSLAAAATALHAGARLIGTNDDATYPSPDAVLPGAGSLLAAVACAGQSEPIVAGKPHPADGQPGARADRRGRDRGRRSPFDRRSSGTAARGPLRTRAHGRYPVPATVLSTRHPISRPPTFSAWSTPARLKARSEGC